MEKYDTVKKTAIKTAFRDSFKGYNKDDVNAYLQDTSLRFSTGEEEYKKKIASLKQTIEELEAKSEDYDHLCGELARINDKLAASDRHLDDNKQKFDEYEKIITSLNNKTEQLTAERDELRGKLNEANDVITQMRNDSDKKARLYDDLSCRLGNLMIIADENASKHVADANEQAGQILTQAKSEAAKIRDEAIAERETLRELGKKKLESALEVVNKRLLLMSEEYIHSYTEYFQNVQTEFDTLLDGLRVKTDEIKSKTSNIRTVMYGELEQELDKITLDTEPEEEIIDQATGNEAIENLVIKNEEI